MPREYEILLVEDNPGDLRLTAETIRQSGVRHRLHGVADGEQALAFLRREGAQARAPRPDLVLLDLNLPRVYGHEVLAAIKTDPVLKSIPVIVLTSSDAERDVIQAYDQHANCYLTKPLALDAFTLLMRNFENFWLRTVTLPASAVQPLNLLLVEDNPGDARLVREYLDSDTTESVSTTHVSSLNAALAQLRTETPDIVVLDLGLPDTQGLEGLTAIQAGAPQLPVVILTGLADQQFGREAVARGAQDYLVKDRLDADTLWRSLRYAVERKRAEERLRVLATRDELTGIANRATILERLRYAIELAARQQQILAVMFIDLDRFKYMNDSYGHLFGDTVIKSMADRVSSTLRAGDLLGRLGGDEFLLIANNVTGPAGAQAAAVRVQEALKTPLRIDSHELTLSASIGIGLFPRDGESVEMLLCNADAALYQAKGHGRDRYEFYDAALNEPARKRVALEAALRQALKTGEFRVHYQPLMDLKSDRLVGVEALLRWQPPGQELVLPDTFIRLSEETGLIVPIGTWVLNTALAQVAALRAADHSDRYVAVNVSPRQLLDDGFPAMVSTALAKSGLPAAALVLELTESTILDPNSTIIGMLNDLRASGLRIALDDFGTGYSSLSALRNLPVDILKIDRSFVSGLGAATADESVVRTIIAFGRNLGMQVVAEGVETTEQLAFLRTEGCDSAQGYFIGRPRAVAEDESPFALSVATG